MTVKCISNLFSINPLPAQEAEAAAVLVAEELRDDHVGGGSHHPLVVAAQVKFESSI
jgi:hypothetical protein